MKYGLTDSELQFLNQKLITPLKEKRAQVFLFGSRATGKYKKFSDIDLFYKTATADIPSHVIYTLLSEIEDSDFPYKIDLAKFDDLAASYLPGIEATKIEL